ncbi:hypothetical protein [Granulicella sp. dw_53]|uniref:hypothetical protein n=1 Tax=Granulicella sp. dw_53 TaxID=2719792 RepID=UPI001BD50047|nr:hypothetical protein [Granulicella sp. dw_53]
MNKGISRQFIFSLLGVVGVLAPLAGHAELRSKSKELVVMESHDLPEQARLPGCSLLLHSDDEGSTYLYVEQQQGKRLTVLDVTDPSRIRVAASTALPTAGAFDFVQPLNDHAELIRFRDQKSVGVLDLRKARKPTVRMLTAAVDSGPFESLGQSGFLAVSEPYQQGVDASRDYQVIDASRSSNPTLLTTVKQVDHRLVNSDTGTTFLLGADGLTVVRRVDVENDYRIHLSQAQGN